MNSDKVKSEISALYLFMIVTSSLIVISASAAAYFLERSGVAALLPLPVVGFLAYLTFNTYYEFKDDHLLCVSGFFKERILYDNIKSIKMAKNFLSSMALSENRIEIRQHGKGWIMGTTYISPKNRDEFYELLKMRCKNLEK